MVASLRRGRLRLCPVARGSDVAVFVLGNLLDRLKRQAIPLWGSERDSVAQNRSSAIIA